MTYIAVNARIARYDLSRALKFRLQAETITEMIQRLNRACEKNGYNWTDYIIFSVD